MMVASRGGEDHSVVEAETQRATAGEEKLERTPTDVLLDISEEALLAELEPHESHYASGWEEAVHGWGRVCPLSCICLTQRQPEKPKQKADNPAPSAPDPLIPDEDSFAGIPESCATQDNSFQKSAPLNELMGSLTISSVAAEQKDLTEWPSVVSESQTTTLNPFLEEKIEGGSLKGTPRLNRLTKPPKSSPNSTIIPIKNFIFPVIESSQPSPQTGKGMNAPGREATEETCMMYGGKYRMRGVRADFSTDSPGLNSRYHRCLYNPHPFTSVQVSSPRRYQLPSVYLRRHMPHRTTFSVGLRYAANVPAHIRPRETGRAVRLF